MFQHANLIMSISYLKPISGKGQKYTVSLKRGSIKSIERKILTVLRNSFWVVGLWVILIFFLVFFHIKKLKTTLHSQKKKKKKALYCLPPPRCSRLKMAKELWPSFQREIRFSVLSFGSGLAEVVCLTKRMWQEWCSGTFRLGHEKLCSFLGPRGHSRWELWAIMEGVGHLGTSKLLVLRSTAPGRSSLSVLPTTAEDMWGKPLESFRPAHLSVVYHAGTSVNAMPCKRITRLSSAEAPDPQNHEIQWLLL